MTGKPKGSWVNLQYAFSIQVRVACDYRHFFNIIDNWASFKSEDQGGELIGESTVAGPVMGFSQAQPGIAAPWLGNVV